MMGDEKIKSSDVELPNIKEPSEDDMQDSKIVLLEPKYQRFVHLYLSGRYTLTAISELLDVSISAIRNWLNRKEVRDVIESVQQQEDEIVKQGIKALRLKALCKMGELIDSNMDAIAYQASRDILDRTGHKAPTKQEVNVEIHTFEQQIKEVIADSNIKDFIEVECDDVDDDTDI